MDAVNFVWLALGRCVDGFFLLLDLVIGSFNSLLDLLSGFSASHHVLLTESTLAEYWNFALFSFLTASEAVSSAACGALHIAEDWLQTFGGVFESFKMVGHLSCHVAWRIKDVLHRGLISGSCILRQTFEGLCIGLSLVVYFFNTLVNLVLIGTQNCLSGLAGVWEVVEDPVYKTVELTLTLLTFLYSCLVGASVLLWTSCQLLVDFLGGLGRVFFTVIMVDSYGLLIAAVFVSLVFLLLNTKRPAFTRRLNPFSVIAPLRTGSVPMIPDQPLANQQVQEDGSPTRLGNTDATNTDPGLTVNEMDCQDVASARGKKTSSPQVPSGMGAYGDRLTDTNLLGLLKEQEERKKCVICQDLTKKVLLLPCRHLCLCRHCTDILIQRRNVQQRCCPLCREPISETMDVYL
ncbi:E3 ubiquitin-protein ligase RNF26-like [Antennarius striatus]|uniref:E3 ubiquitin-protein ligase RNF26-like n=1 Tax=Antennarius striatus TaxID=241820 RepID=UPI0035B47594